MGFLIFPLFILCYTHYIWLNVKNDFTMEDSYVDSAMINIWMVPFYHFHEFPFKSHIYEVLSAEEYNYVLIIERWSESGLLSFKTLQI